MVDFNFLDFNFWIIGHMLHTWYSFSKITTAHSRQQLVEIVTCTKHPDWLTALVTFFKDLMGYLGWRVRMQFSSEKTRWHQYFWMLVCMNIHICDSNDTLSHHHISSKGQVWVRGCWLQDLKSLFVVGLVSQEVLHLGQDGQRQLWKNLWNQRVEEVKRHINTGRKKF